MPDFIVPALDKLVLGATRAADLINNGILSNAGILLNNASNISGVINGTGALSSVTQFLTASGTQSLTAAARIAAASQAVGNGSFAGILGSTSSATSGTISQSAIEELIRKGYTVTKFNVCICPNCIGVLSGRGAHLNVTGFNVQAPIGQAPIQTPTIDAPTLEKAVPLKGVDIKGVQTPDPPVNIGLIIAIVLALKNQIEAGSKTFSDIVTTTLLRGNAGGASPYHNLLNTGALSVQERLVYPILNETSAFVPPILNLARPSGTPPTSLPQIPNREHYPTGQNLFIEERIRNEEQSVQGYFEITQYYHFCHAPGVLNNQSPPDVNTNIDTLRKMLKITGQGANVFPMCLSFNGIDDGNIAAQEVIPITNTAGYWEADASRTEEAQFEPYPDFIVELDDGDRNGNRRNPRSVKKYGFINDGAPTQLSFIPSSAWYFVPTGITEYEHIVIYKNGYRLRMLPELSNQIRVSYLGRSVRERLWKVQSTIIKDTLSIVGAALSPLTGGVSSLVTGVANLFLPTLDFQQNLQTTIDTFVVQWFVPYALHYGSWTTPGTFRLAPKLDSPTSSNFGLATVDIQESVLNGFGTPDGAYRAGTKQGFNYANEFGQELSYGYPSLYHLTRSFLILPYITPSNVSFNQATLSWTKCGNYNDFNDIFSGIKEVADSYVLDVARDINFDDKVIDARVVNGLSSIATGLTPGTTYYARVRGREGDFETENSNFAVATFTTPAQPRPNALPATNVSFDTFTANWTTVNGATDYLLDISTVSNFATTIIAGQIVFGTSFTEANLTPNTTYYYRVRARANGSTSGFSNIITTTTLTLTLDAPVATAATTVLTDQFTAHWQPVANALDYLLDVSTTANFSAPVLTGQVVSGTSFLVPNLTANTRYYYRVRARNGAVLSANSNEITLLTSNVVVPPVSSLDAPVATAETALTHQSFTANWLPVVNANDYLLDVASDAAFGTLVVAGRVVNGVNSAVTGLLPLTPYWYRVRARNGAVLSANSNVINLTTLDTPLPAPVANPAGGTMNFTASWAAVPTADDYVLDVSTSPSFSTFVVQAQTVVGTSQFVGGLTAGATYFYRVRARRGATVSLNSNTVTVQLGLATPTAPIATAATNVLSTSFTANWLDTLGAADYLLDVASDAGFGALVVNSRVVSALSSDVTGLNINTQYWYRIRARNSAGTSGFSNVIGVQTGLMPQPGAPNIISFANVTATSFQVIYSLVSGATGYDVHISTDPNFSTTLATTGAGAGINNVSFSGLATNTTYYVRVRATRALSSPSFSNFSGIANVRLGALAGGTFPQHPLSGFPFGAPDQITTNSFRLLWTPQQDVDILNAPVPNTPVGQTYELDVARDTAFTNLLANNQAVSGLNAFFSNVQNDANFYYSRFYYRLRARSQDGTKVSGNSPTYAVVLSPDPQANMQGVTLSTQGATTNSIDVRINNRDPRTYVGNVNILFRDYYFLEVSLSPSFAQVFVLTPLGGNAIQVGSTTSPNNSGSETAFLSNNDVLSIQGLQPATRYYFRTRAKFVLPASAYAEAVTDVTLGVPNNPPTVLPATQIGQCRFQANWQTANVASYDVEVQKSPSGEFVRLENLAALFLLVNEPQVQPTNFAYRVRSVSAQGARSPYSALQPVVMQTFFDPVAITPSLVTTNSFRVAWAAQTNATQYRVVIHRGATLLVNTIIAGLEYDAIGLTADTVYTVQIFPRNVYGEQYMNPNLAPIIQIVQTLGALSVIPPPAPSLVFVSSTTTSITLNLTGTVANTDYSLDVATDAAFTTLVRAGLYAEAGTSVVMALQPDTLYYARARGYNGAYSPYTATASGRTQLGAPHLLVGEEITTTSFRLRWTSPQSVVQTRVDVARDAAFTDFVLQDVVVVGLLTTVVSGLVQETTYWARVRTENARGITPYSNVREITTDSDDDEVNVATF
jgi:phosphodiesterase/alkaline phosphatase D-like protein